eukprot:7040630-Alexandrium_andersonii.AAC.1
MRVGMMRDCFAVHCAFCVMFPLYTGVRPDGLERVKAIFEAGAEEVLEAVGPPPRVLGDSSASGHATGFSLYGVVICAEVDPTIQKQLLEDAREEMLIAVWEGNLRGGTPGRPSVKPPTRTREAHLTTAERDRRDVVGLRELHLEEMQVNVGTVLYDAHVWPCELHCERVEDHRDGSF